MSFEVGAKGKNDQPDVLLHSGWLTASSHELTRLESAPHNADNSSLPRSRPCAEEEMDKEQRIAPRWCWWCAHVGRIPARLDLGHDMVSSTGSARVTFLTYLEKPPPKASRRGAKRVGRKMNRVSASYSSPKEEPASPAASGLPD